MYRLVLDYPPLLNTLYRTANGRVYKSSAAKDYADAVGWKARAEGCEPLAGPIVLSVDVYRPRKAGDIDAPLKLLLDCLQGHLYNNDAQIVEIHARRFDDKEHPRIEVTVREKLP